ncbi:MAG: hypothetical protein C5B45_04010 [Chlamydiae bacterium]|nr:MAG: hypothetical protein C5B45_04010 [Chlamydiota bacterium]
MSKIVPFVMCIFLVQALLSFTESRSDYNENDIQKNFEDATTCWLRSFLKKAMQDSMYERSKSL